MATLLSSNLATSEPLSKSKGWQWPPFYTFVSKSFVARAPGWQMVCSIQGLSWAVLIYADACSRSRIDLLTLPVAHQHASLASRTTMLLPFALASSVRYLAADVPVIPVPTTTMSASAGSSSVVRCPSKNLFGSLCQNEFVDVGVGRVERGCFMMANLWGTVVIVAEAGWRLK